MRASFVANASTFRRMCVATRKPPTIRCRSIYALSVDALSAEKITWIDTCPPTLALRKAHRLRSASQTPGRNRQPRRVSSGRARALPAATSSLRHHSPTSLAHHFWNMPRLHMVSGSTSRTMPLSQVLLRRHRLAQLQWHDLAATSPKHDSNVKAVSALPLSA